MNTYLLALAHPHFAAHYRRDTLNSRDQARLQAKPHVEKRTQWQTSRALLAHLRERYPDMKTCLTHKLDHSAVAVGAEKPGIDLEKLRARDVHAIAAHSFSAQECALMQASTNPDMLFYQLWTIKEALIKLENLRFPVHLRHTGLRDGAIFSPSGAAYRWSTLLLDEAWLLTGVWVDRGDLPLELHIHAPQVFTVRTLAGNLPDAEVRFYPII